MSQFVDALNLDVIVPSSLCDLRKRRFRSAAVKPQRTMCLSQFVGSGRLRRPLFPHIAPGVSSNAVAGSVSDLATG